MLSQGANVRSVLACAVLHVRQCPKRVQCVGTLKINVKRLKGNTIRCVEGVMNQCLSCLGDIGVRLPCLV